MLCAVGTPPIRNISLEVDICGAFSFWGSGDNKCGRDVVEAAGSLLGDLRELVPLRLASGAVDLTAICPPAGAGAGAPMAVIAAVAVVVAVVALGGAAVAVWYFKVHKPAQDAVMKLSSAGTGGSGTAGHGASSAYHHNDTSKLSAIVNPLHGPAVPTGPWAGAPQAPYYGAHNMMSNNVAVQAPPYGLAGEYPQPLAADGQAGGHNWQQPGQQMQHAVVLSVPPGMVTDASVVPVAKTDV